MANIMAILPGMSFGALSGMELAELMRWHEHALNRSGNEKKSK